MNQLELVGRDLHELANQVAALNCQLFVMQPLVVNQPALEESWQQMSHVVGEMLVTLRALQIESSMFQGQSIDTESNCPH